MLITLIYGENIPVNVKRKRIIRTQSTQDASE
jgi:hypothetical protein